MVLRPVVCSWSIALAPISSPARGIGLRVLRISDLLVIGSVSGCRVSNAAASIVGAMPSDTVYPSRSMPIPDLVVDRGEAVEVSEARTDFHPHHPARDIYADVAGELVGPGGQGEGCAPLICF